MRPSERLAALMLCGSPSVLMRVADMEVDVMDLRRMFLGDLPWTFLFEVVFRTAFLYSYTFVLIRVMRRQATGELSLVEVLLIVALGSAVGDPMFYPDVPLLHGMAVLTTVVLLNQGFGALVTRSRRVEVLLEGRPSQVVQAGRLCVKDIAARAVAPEELFELLRNRGVEHLGQVRAAYIEQNGRLSVFRYPLGDERRGLALEPPEELSPARRYGQGGIIDAGGYYACCTCGDVRQFAMGETVQPCDQGHFDWATRVSEPRGAPSMG